MNSLEDYCGIIRLYLMEPKILLLCFTYQLELLKLDIHLNHVMSS